MSSNMHMRNESKNLKLTRSLYKISQETNPRIIIEKKKKTGGKPRITDDEVREMRRLNEQKILSPKQIADKFKIAFSTTRNILNYELRGKVL